MGSERKSIADIEAALWDNGLLIQFAYLSDPDTTPIRSPNRRRKVSRKLLDNFRNRLAEARGLKLTGRPRSDAFGELGEYFAAIMFGITLHDDPRTQGSDGKLGSDFVEVKTITPGKRQDVVWMNPARNFSKIVVVKITNDFQFGARMVARRILKNRPGKRVKLAWNEMIGGCGARALEVHRNFPMIKSAVRKA